MKRIGFIALFIAAFLAFAAQTAAQSARQNSAMDSYRLETNSSLAIEGTSTVDAFVCESSISEEPIRERGAQGSDDSGAKVVSGKDGVSLIVPVESFDCGKARMNRDMYAALRASSHPDVMFLLEDVQVLASRTDADQEYELRVSGRLSLAGTERDVAVRVIGSRLPDGRVRAQGAVSLLMSDFGVTPPSALLGLVRAHDRIDVVFDLFAVDVQTSHASR